MAARVVIAIIQLKKRKTFEEVGNQKWLIEIPHLIDFTHVIEKKM